MRDFEDFAGANLRPLLRLATAISGDSVLAEDLVQDVLLKVQRRWTKIAVLDVPESYVRRMLVNEFLSWRRKFARVHLVSDPDPPPAADHADRHAVQDELRRHLAPLPRRQQVVLALRYFAGYSDRDIARALGCAEGTVRGHASRGLATLRLALPATSAEPNGAST